ncbi:MAG: hypothetical protein KDJ69_08560 [Nitratireductor sp.]|nr:hypothetical protein [Nitratireductor sp.]
MSLRITATGVVEICPGIWELNMPPHQVRHFGNTSHAFGSQSVLMFHSCSYDAKQQQLHFDLEDVTPINVGTTAKAIGIAVSASNTKQTTHLAASSPDPTPLGPGDREFLQLAKRELSGTTARAAEKLLLGVREKSAGNLKRGQARNFSETPDNFWYIIIQPRVDELSITVRGPVDRFAGLTGIEVKDDRGNTRFKVRDEGDVADALKLIFHAIRKQ